MDNRGKRYSQEFKEDAIRLAISNGRKVPGVAEDLGINQQTLYRWIKEYNDAKNNTEKSHIAELETKLKAANKRVREMHGRPKVCPYLNFIIRVFWEIVA